MTRRKRTLLGTRSRSTDDSTKPLPLAAWSQVELPTHHDPKPPPGEAPKIEQASKTTPAPEPAAPVPLQLDDPFTTLVPQDGLLGNRIGQWTVYELIGRAQGCSLVRAHHHQSSRIKATLKVLDAEHFEDPQARERLVREGEILFPLDHPSIATVRNLMLGHDPPYLEFEQLRGESLDRILQRRSALFMAEALDLVEQLLGILVYLHEKEVFHLDIEPANVMVRPDGVITLIGFSNAVEREVPRQVRPATPLSYLPPEWPELARPELADLYATGALLYQLLTGERPFGAPVYGGSLTTALVLDEKNRAPFLDPGGRFHEDLRAVTRHLTTREPAGRLADAADALGRLQSVERSYAS